ncbi:MAG: GNAT family N-acetyltransferase [Bacteroidetes bacterium]|nr:GNAT family N-acetyltransferase [Bacteroidota bacterium]
MIHLVIASEKELSTIAQLAHTIWNEHYVPIVGQQQVDYMLAKIYNHASLVEQLNEKKHVFYLIKNNQQNIGFVSVSATTAHDFFLHKFYIDQQKSNAGIGTQVLDLLIKEIGPKSLTLTVNRQNFKSINFYFKNGFKIDRVEDFDIGNGYQMNDFVMVRKLS